MISLDQSLFADSGQGDTLARFHWYARYVRSFTVLVPFQGSATPKTIGKIRLIPALGSQPCIIYFNLFFLLLQKLWFQPPNLIVTNNLVLTFLVHWAQRLTHTQVPIHTNVYGLEAENQFWIKERWQNRFFKIIQQQAINYSTSFRTDNFSERYILLTKYHVPPTLVTTVPTCPSPASQKKFLQAKPNQALRKKLAKNLPLILSVGNLFPAKDYSSLLRAAYSLNRRIPMAKFIIVGQGPQQKNIQSEIKKLQLQDTVSLLGSVSYKFLPQLYKSADMFLMTSTHEGLSRSLLEACLTATPVISTSTYGVSDIIRHNYSGLIVPVRSISLITKSIKYYLSHPQKAHTFAQRAQKFTAKYLNYQQNLNKLMLAWDHTLNV